MKGSALVAKSLRSLGIKYVFGMTGSSIADIIDSIYAERPDVNFVGVRHEQVAASMADAYARTTLSPSSCIFQWGPGAANAMLGVVTAFRDSSPVIFMTGETPTEKMGREVFHEWDQLAIYGRVTKWSHLVLSTREIPRVFKIAYTRALTGRPGPVHIDLPIDMVQKDADVPEPQLTPLTTDAWRTRPNSTALAKAKEIILSSKQPVILAGSGTVWSRASAELQELAELLNIPVVVSASARGIIPEDHPLALGMLWVAVGRTTSKAALNAIESTDCLIALGCRLSDVTTNSWTVIPKSAKIIQVHIDPSELGFQYDLAVGLQADPKIFLEDLITALRNDLASTQSTSASLKNSPRLRDLQECRKLFFDYLETVKSGKLINPWSIIRELNRLLKEKSIVTVGAGTHSWFGSFLPRYRPGSGMKAIGFGSMGFAFPAALGAKMAAPDWQVVACDGDGGFMTVMQDLETAVRHNISTVTVIFNDRSLGAERWKTKSSFGERYYEVDIRTPDLARIAEAFGATGFRVERESELRAALEGALKSGGPAVVDVLVDPWISPALYKIN